MSEQRFAVWAAGAAYERYMGRWSRLVAAEFAAWLDRDRSCGGSTWDAGRVCCRLW
ncbi:hypothetical protein ABZ016_10115 [Streptomyces sp. NPDC006372]|uniref:hypothetical protein n=1 Tax=Streptomyces sp. NPDC006372 TaxID=3155599 RepID=UPI0033AE6461